MANAAQLNIKAIFTDTIIFQYNKILVGRLPKNLRYKLLTEDEMCTLMAAGKQSGLQFFALEEFEKKPNGYKTSFSTHCMARLTGTKYQSKSIDTVCQREIYCNTVLKMDIIKKGNTLAGSKPWVMTY